MTSSLVKFRRSPVSFRLLATPPAADELANSAAPPNQPSVAGANDQAVLSLLQQLDSRLAAAVVVNQQQQLDLQQTAIELALVAAECLASQCTQQGNFDVAEMVRRAVETCEPADDMIVLLNPLDLQLVKEATANDEAGRLLSRSKADARIRRGECVVSAGSQQLVSTISDRLESIRSAWMESLDDVAA